MKQALLDHLAAETAKLKDAGLYKQERVLTSPQQAMIRVADGRPVLNLCANNYLGLANSPALIEAARDALPKYGFGLSSVRFICGTQDVHKTLERRLSEFLGTDDTILYSSCFDANGGLFETLLGEEDAVISDALNHASIIDGIRLSKAQRFRYRNRDMADLREQLVAAQGARFKLIATDGVFSMDGTLADLASVCDLADEFGALVMVDDSHAVGFVGERGRGTHEHCGVMGRVDIITGTLGKALGGASGGYTSGRREIVEWLRQRSRPYLFSNTLAPVIAATPAPSGTSRSPAPVISNNPNSSVVPNRFLIARTIRWLWYRSPSKYSTASTRCSRSRGPANTPSFVTCPTSTTATPLSFARYTSSAQHRRNCVMLPGDAGTSGL